MPDKRVHYEHLFERMGLAMDSHFFLEAAWIAHALLEDRLESAIRYSSAAAAGNLYGRIRNLKAALDEDISIRGAFHGNLLARIDGWRVDRNAKTHDLGNEVRPVEELIVEFEALASRGVKLSRETAAAVMRLKKINAKRVDTKHRAP